MLNFEELAKEYGYGPAAFILLHRKFPNKEYTIKQKPTSRGNAHREFFGTDIEFPLVYNWKPEFSIHIPDEADSVDNLVICRRLAGWKSDHEREGWDEIARVVDVTPTELYKALSLLISKIQEEDRKTPNV